VYSFLFATCFYFSVGVYLKTQMVCWEQVLI